MRECEDQRRRTRRGPIASRVTYVVYNMHSRHLHREAEILVDWVGAQVRFQVLQRVLQPLHGDNAVELELSTKQVCTTVLAQGSPMHA
jgi:hypothetical protein